MKNIHAQMEQMLADIQAEAQVASMYTGRGSISDQVISAISRVPRHKFVPEESGRDAYRNCPLPIGHGQTISQPYIVALMTDLLDLNRESIVLEVGTGCGYQTAVLAEIARQVYSVEIIGDMAVSTERRLRTMGYSNVSIRHGDGHLGWPEHAPYDGIIVTAAVSKAPPVALLAQLRQGGNMVVPVGTQHHAQNLMLISRDVNGSVSSRTILPVVFVPCRHATEADSVL